MDRSARSRGAMVNAFLTQPADKFPSTAAFVENLVSGDEGLKGVGGFSLVCGKVGEPLAVVSNQTASAKGTTWVMEGTGETVGLSNAAFGDRSWPKVSEGQKLLTDVIKQHARSNGKSQSDLIDALFGVLSTDTLPKRPTLGSGKTEWESFARELRNSIFIPAIGGEGMDGVSAEELAAARGGQQFHGGAMGSDGLSGMYGTQKQSVILVSHQGHVDFIERTLYDEDARATEKKERDRSFEFDIEGWKM